MKVRKVAIAIAFLGGMLFTAQEFNLIDLNDQSTTQIDRSKIKVPGGRR